MKSGKATRAHGPRGKSAPASAPVSRARQGLFRLAAVVLVPLALFAMVELGLRLVGYGYPTGFFLERMQEGRRILIENRQFGWRFFPPHLARTPQPLVLTAQKPAETCRIFFFGESAAMGDPDPDFGPPRALQVILREQFPGKQIEVVNVAMTAINSHAVREIARDCGSREGDVWVVYMGNNEVIGPFGAGTIFGAAAPPIAMIRTTLALGRMRLGQLMEGLMRGVLRNEPIPRTWGGLKMFLDHQLRSDDPRLRRVREHYRRNLEEIIRLGTASGAKVVVCTVASNLRECAPFGSQHRAGLSSEQLGSWEESYQKGIGLENAHRFEEAAKCYQEAALIDDSFATLQFRLGRCLVGMGKSLEARRSFEGARDEDTLRFRSDRLNNEIVRTVASNRENEGVFVVDLENHFASRSPEGIPGLNFFWEHVHFNFSGTYVMAEAVARQVAELMPGPFQRDPRSNIWLSERDCAIRLSYSRWNEHKILAEIFRRHQGPPCRLQMDYEERSDLWRKRLADGQRSAQPAALLENVAGVRAVVQAHDFDWVVHKNVGQMLEAAGDLTGAFGEWDEVARRVPQYANAFYHLGNLLDQMGKSVEAEAQFRRALVLEPNMAEAQSGLGLALAAQGKLEEAFRAYARAVSVNPDSIHAYINWGIGLASRGQFAEAIGKYEIALKLNPDDAIAHNNLGLSLAAMGRGEEALRHYSRALELKPGSLSARLNMGRELVRMKRYDEAVAVLEAGLAASPGAGELHLRLGLAYEQLGRGDDAVRQFEEALRISPGQSEAQEALVRLRPTR